MQESVRFEKQKNGAEEQMKKRIAAAVLGMIMTASFMQNAVVFADDEFSIIDNINRPTGDMAVREPSDPMEMLSGEDVEELNQQMQNYTQKYSDLLINHAVNYYYYNNLDPIAKEIYDVMYGVCKDPVSEGNIGLMMTDMDPQSDEFYYEFNMASRAICFDHPELFWLYSREEAQMGYSSEAVSQNGFYFVYILMSDRYEDFEEDMTAFNNAAQAFLADIDTGISEYETIRQIHDKLIDLVNYNDPAADAIRFSRGQDLAHTAYGALVADSSGIANYAVCDGYTLAFEYLLQQCGIETVFIGGMAGSDEASAGMHAWSLVKMDGAWYEVDTTWDDNGSLYDDLTEGTVEYQYYTEALDNAAYRETIDHAFFLVSTEQISHFVPDDTYTYETQDGQYLLYLVSESIHHRLSDVEDYDDYDAEIISTAPMAVSDYTGGILQ